MEAQDGCSAFASDGTSCLEGRRMSRRSLTLSPNPNPYTNPYPDWSRSLSRSAARKSRDGWQYFDCICAPSQATEATTSNRRSILLLADGAWIRCWQVYMIPKALTKRKGHRGCMLQAMEQLMGIGSAHYKCASGTSTIPQSLAMVSRNFACVFEVQVSA